MEGADIHRRYRGRRWQRKKLGIDVSWSFEIRSGDEGIQRVQFPQRFQMPMESATHNGLRPTATETAGGGNESRHGGQNDIETGKVSEIRFLPSGSEGAFYSGEQKV